MEHKRRVYIASGSTRMLQENMPLALKNEFGGNVGDNDVLYSYDDNDL